jgi:transposase-like protein
LNQRIQWVCPHCKAANDDEIDPVYGPFHSCTCDGCGKSFDQSEVQRA